jgi:hypothetical protein
MRRTLLLSWIVFTLLSSKSTHAVTIVSGPSLTTATNAPLAAHLQLTTDVDTRVSVLVDSGTETWTRNFYDYGTNHSIPLIGFLSNSTNLISVTVQDKSRNALAAATPLTFVTAPLPGDFPNITLLQSVPEKMEPGYTLFRVAFKGNSKAYHTIVDNSGNVVWYSAFPSQLDIRPLANGDLFLFSSTTFTEINMLGEPVQTWKVPANLTIDSHDGVPTDHGTILYISTASAVVSNYPTSTTNPNAPLQTANNVIYARTVEISATNSALLNTWSLLDMLEPQRITYLTTLGPPSWDSQHANAVIEDPSDNSIIVSLRHQNAVVKFSRTGQLIWILGDPANWGLPWQPYLLTPVGTSFAWQYGQHSPSITPQGTLLVYDDGNYRASPFNPPIPDANNYSRAVEYKINEETMEVSQVWDYGTGISQPLYTDKVGDAEQLPTTGNVLVTFGSVRYVNGAPPSAVIPTATIARIKEVTHDNTEEVVFDLAVTEFDNPLVQSDCFVYRSRRIADLYAHPAAAVSDLAVSYEQGVPLLSFSADPARTYSVEASTDLIHWQTIGTASQDVELGIFQFQDTSSLGDPARFYRVATQ